MSPNPPDAGLLPFFQGDHRACDQDWSQVEAAASADNQADAQVAWQAFNAHTRRHLDMEEGVIFPAFEDATGMHGGGPTAMMRAEHEQMRALLDQIGEAIAAGDLSEVLDQGDTLLMLTQQHNVKEEQILYPMAQQHLAPRWPALVDQLNRYLSP